MSNVYEAKTKCPCGSQVIAQIKRPKAFEASFHKASCVVCGSRFSFQIKSEKTNEVRRYRVYVDILQLSPLAESTLEREISARHA